MALDNKLEIRPRTAGEVLDDAWRLYLANAPQLLLLAGLFAVPAAVALLFLLTRPAPADWLGQAWLPALAAGLLPLTGLGSAACQEVFRSRAEGRPVRVGACLKAALWNGLAHVTARALVLVATAVAALLLGVPALAVLMFAAPLHALLAAGERRVFATLLNGRELQKAAVVTLGRLFLLLFAVINLYLLVEMSLWVAGNLGGLDTALADVLLSPKNLVYDAALTLFAWLVLIPFTEAANYLLYVDARVRHEGFDLRFQIERLFPQFNKSRAGVVLLALGTGCFVAGPARAEDGRLDAIRGVRQDLGQIAREVKEANPYPGGDRWLPRLRGLADRLEEDVGRDRRYRWFDEAVDSFARRKADEAVQALADLDRRLALVEESLELRANGDQRGRSREDIKKLLPEPPDDSGGPNARDPAKKAKRKEERPVKKDEPEEGRRVEVRGPGVVSPGGGGGFGTLGWLLLAGLVLAVLVTAGVFFLRERRSRPPATPKPTGAVPENLDDLLSQPRPQTAAELWRKAEQFAAAGNHLEAVRALYLAVLAHLHRANLIHYERTRTNGEYVRQVHLAPAAPEPVHEAFERLTRLFELKWYGERASDPDDYATCRALAVEIRDEVTA